MPDVRDALRMLLKAPAMSVMAIVTLALGIGATAAIFSLVNATLVRPLPGIGEPDRVVTIGRTIDGEGFDNSSYLNYAAAERTREMGIRLALGATATDIVRLFTVDAARLVAVGALLGVILARAAARLMSTLLFGVTPGDPVTHASAVALLAVVVLVACTAPAVRATRVDPMIAVRAE